MNAVTTRPGMIITIAAPSGCGKTSITKALLEQDKDLVLSISHTTRSPRDGEQNGKHYHFVSHQEFEDLKEQGAFVESAEVFGHCYATSNTALIAPLTVGHDVLLDIDWQGAQQVRHQFPGKSISIFLLPPSRAALMQRLKNRGQDSDAIIAKRMAAATDEMSHYQEFDYVVINDDFDLALATVQNIIDAERHTMERQRVAQEKLLLDLLA